MRTGEELSRRQSPDLVPRAGCSQRLAHAKAPSHECPGERPSVVIISHKSAKSHGTLSPIALIEGPLSNTPHSHLGSVANFAFCEGSVLVY